MCMKQALCFIYIHTYVCVCLYRRVPVHSKDGGFSTLVALYMYACTYIHIYIYIYTHIHQTCVYVYT